MIRLLLAAEGDWPPCHVINLARSGEYIRRLIDTGQYKKLVSKLPGLDCVLIRYGLNDAVKREKFEENFPKDYQELIALLRKDHPAATIIPMTVIPMAFKPEGEDSSSERINKLVRRIAAEGNLPLLDIYSRYYQELKKGTNMLNYRRFPLSKIPEKYRDFVKPFVMEGKTPFVVVLDNRLDAHFGNLPGWFGDRHPNLAGYHVIGDETAKFLAPMIRAKHSNAPARNE